MDEISRDFRQTALPFAVWGFLVGFFLPYVPEAFRLPASSLVTESIAANTVTSFLYFSMLGCGVFLTIFGVVEDQNTIRRKLYDWLIRRPIRFGMTFAAVAVGVLFGAALSAFCHWQLEAIMTIMGGAAVMAVAYAEMFLLARLVVGPAPRIRRVIYARLAGLLVLCLLLVVAWTVSANAA